MMALKELEQQLNKNFPQRERPIRAIILAILTKEHAYLHGSPGTAKSLLARTTLKALPGTKFYTTLSSSRPPEALLGPYDIQALQQSQFIRHDDGYLTTADYALLDEIGKINPKIGHDLLAALNERVKHQVVNGRTEHAIPLKTAICTSNEAMTSDDSKALWDRILIRCDVTPLTSLTAMLNAQDAPLPKITNKQLTEAQHAVTNITYNAHDVYTSVDTLAKKAREKGVTVTDRRALRSIHVMQAHAYLEGRTTITHEDLPALSYTLWEPNKGNPVAETMAELIEPKPKPLTGTFEEIKAQAKKQARQNVKHNKQNTLIPLMR